jgi:hypothetical protein
LLLCLLIRRLLPPRAAYHADHGSYRRTRAGVTSDGTADGTHGGAARRPSGPAPFVLGSLN